MQLAGSWGGAWPASGDLSAAGRLGRWLGVRIDLRREALALVGGDDLYPAFAGAIDLVAVVGMEAPAKLLHGRFEREAEGVAHTQFIPRPMKWEGIIEGRMAFHLE